ncbi:MAG: polyhydroxyalkanoic acid system family protein [Myxococcota bacterium]|nr:polyhydroxyalkanoic acid system family protein [Myxococcota bacterium]
MKHDIRHGLDADLAKRVAVAALESYAERLSEYGPRVQWISEHEAQVSFSVKGLNLKGSVGVSPSVISLNLDVPFVLRMFKKKAVSVIEREINVWLTKARNGELDVD